MNKRQCAHTKQNISTWLIWLHHEHNFTVRTSVSRLRTHRNSHLETTFRTLYRSVHGYLWLFLWHIRLVYWRRWVVLVFAGSTRVACRHHGLWSCRFSVAIWDLYAPELRIVLGLTYHLHRRIVVGSCHLHSLHLHLLHLHLLHGIWIWVQLLYLRLRIVLRYCFRCLRSYFELFLLLLLLGFGFYFWRLRRLWGC